VEFKGFWISKWFKEHSMQQRKEMLTRIVEMIQRGLLKFETISLPLTEDSFKEMQRIQQTEACKGIRKKFLLVNK
jgi:hypothetical protein